MKIEIHIYNHAAPAIADPAFQTLITQVQTMSDAVQQIEGQLDGMSSEITEIGSAVTTKLAEKDAIIAELQQKIADGATPEELQAISDRLTATQAGLDALQSSIAPAPPPDSGDGGVDGVTPDAGAADGGDGGDISMGAQ